MRAHDGSIPLMKSRLQLGNSRSLPSSHSMQPHYRHRKSAGKSISTLGMHWRGLWYKSTVVLLDVSRRGWVSCGRNETGEGEVGLAY